MADCGASGSVIDRAARLLQPPPSQSSASPWFEQATRLSLPQTSAMTAVPDFLPAPELQLSQQKTSSLPVVATVETPSSSMQRTAPSFVPHPHYTHPSTARYDNRVIMHPNQSSPYMIHQQQQQQGILLQQQQQLLMQRQQQILWMQQQSSREHSVETRTESTQVAADDGIVQPVSMEELASAWKEANQQEFDVPDQAIGATIDELTLAWQHAQVEYQKEMDDLAADYNDNNLWTGDVETDELNAYEFRNAIPHTALPERTLDQATQTESHNTVPQRNWMDEGMQAFQAGNLHTAIRAFEMELQLHDMENATAWTMLGRCHAEQDMDQAAIQCLEEAVQRDPYAIDALLALGVSYVNELHQARALQYLKAWITHNPQFANLELEVDPYGAPTVVSSNQSHTTHFDEVQRLLLQALESVAAGDPSTTARVLEALGVVYNVSRDYDAAIDVLQQACALRPHEYPLWNKLGATLANSGRSAEALSAYQEALQLKPRYARAWLNMAIAHSNLEQYHDAARCYLQTLSINPAAAHVWSFLRIALSCLERTDLLPLVTERNLEALAEHFEFVTYQDDVPKHAVA